jgi:ABC-type lipoprotein release transport system permease subunit
MAMFLAESSLLAVGGILMGLVVGLLLVGYFSRFGLFIGNVGTATGLLVGSTLYTQLTTSDAVGLTIAAFVVTLLAGLYPAVLASRMEPVTALRGQE